MYHSLTIGSKNTWDDWHLVPTERPVISFPEPKIKTETLDSGNGMLDLSESLSNAVSYKNSQGSFVFYMMNDYGDTITRYSEIMNYLHGKTLPMTMEDAPGERYECRFSVSSIANGMPCTTLTIEYMVMNIL